MDKQQQQQERELHKAIDSVLIDNLSPLVNRAGIIGLRELILDAIDNAHFDIVRKSVIHAPDANGRDLFKNEVKQKPIAGKQGKVLITDDYNKAADAVEWEDKTTDARRKSID